MRCCGAEYVRVRLRAWGLLQDATGTKPDPPKDIADVPLFLSLYRNKATLYRDLSGAAPSLRRLYSAGRMSHAARRAPVPELVAVYLVHAQVLIYCAPRAT